jgi:hypothetical protein
MAPLRRCGNGCHRPRLFRDRVLEPARATVTRLRPRLRGAPLLAAAKTLGPSPRVSNVPTLETRRRSCVWPRHTTVARACQRTTGRRPSGIVGRPNRGWQTRRFNWRRSMTPAEACRATRRRPRIGTGKRRTKGSPSRNTISRSCTYREPRADARHCRSGALVQAGGRARCGAGTVQPGRGLRDGRRSVAGRRRGRPLVSKSGRCGGRGGAIQNGRPVRNGQRRGEGPGRDRPVV